MWYIVVEGVVALAVCLGVVFQMRRNLLLWPTWIFIVLYIRDFLVGFIRGVIAQGG